MTVGQGRPSCSDWQMQSIRTQSRSSPTTTELFITGDYHCRCKQHQSRVRLESCVSSVRCSLRPLRRGSRGAVQACRPEVSRRARHQPEGWLGSVLVGQYLHSHFLFELQRLDRTTICCLNSRARRRGRMPPIFLYKPASSIRSPSTSTLATLSCSTTGATRCFNERRAKMTRPIWFRLVRRRLRSLPIF